jgi:hypothetical protein
MGKINRTRVLLGGLVAGVIINIFEFVLNGVIITKDMEDALRALGRQLGMGELAMFTVWAFMVGVFAVWLYAAIRPRYGAGPKTALCAGRGGVGTGIRAGVGHPACAETVSRPSHSHWAGCRIGRSARRNARWCVTLP